MQIREFVVERKRRTSWGHVTKIGPELSGKARVPRTSDPNAVANLHAKRMLTH